MTNQQEAQKVLRKFSELANELEHEGVIKSQDILEHEDWYDLALQVANLQMTISNLRCEDRYKEPMVSAKL